MFEGSMYGKGAIMFAVWSYVIAHMQPDKEVGTQVELNPEKLAHTLGENESDVVKAIDRLCAPDPKSRTPDEGGRRLIRLSQFDYRVVNGAKYRAIRDEEKRREQNRQAQAKFREKNKIKPPKQNPLPGETAYCEAQKRLAASEDGGGM